MVLGLEKNTKVSYIHICGRHDQLTLETPYVYVLVCCVQMKRFRFHQKLCLLPQIINGIKQFHKYQHVDHQNNAWQSHIPLSAGLWQCLGKGNQVCPHLARANSCARVAAYWLSLRNMQEHQEQSDLYRVNHPTVVRTQASNEQMRSDLARLSRLSCHDQSCLAHEWRRQRGWPG